MGQKGNKNIVDKMIRFPDWMVNGIQKIADYKKITFTETVIEAMRARLAEYGITIWEDKLILPKNENSMESDSEPKRPAVKPQTVPEQAKTKKAG